MSGGRTRAVDFELGPDVLSNPVLTLSPEGEACENQWARLWFEGGLAVRAVILEAVWVFSLESTIYLVTIFFVYWNIQNLLMGIVQILF